MTSKIDGHISMRALRLCENYDVAIRNCENLSLGQKDCEWVKARNLAEYELKSYINELEALRDGST